MGGVGWLQNSSRIIFLLSQIVVVLTNGWRPTLWVGFSLVVFSMLLAILPASFIIPNTINEICSGLSTYQTPVDHDIYNNRYWVGWLFVVTSIVACCDFRKGSDSQDLSQPLNDEADRKE